MKIKQGDTANAIKSALTKNGEPVDLTDCRVFISVSGKISEDECMIVDAEQGKIAYPVGKISDVDGFYNYEFIVKYSDGTQETVPNKSYESLRVFKSIKGGN